MNTNIKPFFRQTKWMSNMSLNVKVDIKENLSNQYHYHQEMELILIRKSRGKRIINAIHDVFEDNDLLLIGKNVPHAFFHDKDSYLMNPFEQPEAIVVHFNDNLIATDFFKIPEFKDLTIFFQSIGLGMSITSSGKKQVIPLMEKMVYMNSFQRVITLFEVFKILTDNRNWSPLCGDTSSHSKIQSCSERIQKIIDYTQKNYYLDIKIEEISALIYMTKESFCRFFKSQTNQTYVEFLNEFRIKIACSMLSQNQMTIKEICFACGFNSLSNFHFQFKKIMKASPLNYRPAPLSS